MTISPDTSSKKQVPGSRSACIILALFLAASFTLGVSVDAKSPPQKPNIVLIFTDDQGYGDLGCFGSKHVKTPTIDRLAENGAKFTSFYVAAPYCTASRAALMTGCYPVRVGLNRITKYAVLLAGEARGLNPEEDTIADVLKRAGYATGCVGKWHLGDQPEFLPTRQGFDYFFGIPYSHDVHPYHLQQKLHNFPPLPLLENEKAIGVEPHPDTLTGRLTEKAVAFIEKNKERPFFLYFAHPMPHVPFGASPQRQAHLPKDVRRRLAGKRVDYHDRKQLFPQTISDIDASVEAVVKTLERLDLDRRTLIVFTSDNGPPVLPHIDWVSRLSNAGPLREGKGSSYEGGHRVPFVAYWPGQIPAGLVSDEPITAIDLLPTFARLAGATLVEEREIDGLDTWDIIAGKSSAKYSREVFLYSHIERTARAARSGPWKIVFSSQTGRKFAKPELYNLHDDIGEKNNVANQHPDQVARMIRLVNQEQAKLVPSRCRPVGQVENPKPIIAHDGTIRSDMRQ